MAGVSVKESIQRSYDWYKENLAGKTAGQVAAVKRPGGSHERKGLRRLETELRKIEADAAKVAGMQARFAQWQSDGYPPDEIVDDILGQVRGFANGDLLDNQG